MGKLVTFGGRHAEENSTGSNLLVQFARQRRTGYVRRRITVRHWVLDVLSTRQAAGFYRCSCAR